MSAAQSQALTFVTTQRDEMPLPTDEKLLKLSHDLVATLDKTFGGEHPGYRAAHARGILLQGSPVGSAGARLTETAANERRAKSGADIALPFVTTQRDEMPLPTDEKLLKLSHDLVAALDKTFGGEHPGYRAAHARGLLLQGSFTPTAAAAQLSSAPHFAPGSTTPVTARFSSSTGLPRIPDTDPAAQPRGLALRFELGPHRHTDIVAHSTDGFPARTGEEFHALFEALGTGPEAAGAFLAAHPAAAAFVAAPKPCPASFATEAYYALNAYRFVPSGRFVRYTFVPVAGVQHLAADAVKERGPDFLYGELEARIADKVEFELWAQLANDGDVTDDATVRWPAERERVLLGTVVLDKIAERNAEAQKQIIFDPVPRVEGIEPSADPLLDVRAAVYLVSGRRRRAAHQVE